MSDGKQVFSVELDSRKPSGKVKDSLSGLEEKFENIGELAHFLKANYKAAETVEEKAVEVQNAVEEKKEEKCDKQEALPKKKDIVMPERKKIAEELKKISNFTDEELSIMGWSSMYKAYSLIVRYGQTGVEDQFRNNDWWAKEMKKLAQTKKKDKSDKKEKTDSKDSKKAEREQKKQQKKAKKEERKAKKVERKAKKDKK